MPTKPFDWNKQNEKTHAYCLHTMAKMDTAGIDVILGDSASMWWLTWCRILLTL
jgi:hypothetical protein